MKRLSLESGAYNALFWRVAAGTIIAGGAFFLTRQPLPPRDRIALHIWRGFISTVMTLSFFWGLVRLPLAEAVALSFIAPLITLYLAAVLLGEKIGRAVILASVLSIAGVLVIVAGKMGSSSFSPDAKWGVVAIFFSAVVYAYNLILQRKQAQIASPIEIVFFQHMAMLAFLAMLAPFLASLPTTDQIPRVIGAAVFALIALFMGTWAYARAEVQRMVIAEYTAFIWAAIFGWIFFQETVTPATFIGTLLIIAGCIIATRPVPQERMNER